MTYSIGDKLTHPVMGIVGVWTVCGVVLDPNGDKYDLEQNGVRITINKNDNDNWSLVPQPKFQVGDLVTNKLYTYRIDAINNGYYYTDRGAYTFPQLDCICFKVEPFKVEPINSPKFKVHDRVRNTTTGEVFRIGEICGTGYIAYTEDVAGRITTILFRDSNVELMPEPKFKVGDKLTNPAYEGVWTVTATDLPSYGSPYRIEQGNNSNRLSEKEIGEWSIYPKFKTGDIITNHQEHYQIEGYTGQYYNMKGGAYSMNYVDNNYQKCGHTTQNKEKTPKFKVGDLISHHGDTYKVLENVDGYKIEWQAESVKEIPGWEKWQKIYEFNQKYVESQFTLIPPSIVLFSEITPGTKESFFWYNEGLWYKFNAKTGLEVSTGNLKVMQNEGVERAKIKI